MEKGHLKINYWEIQKFKKDFPKGKIPLSISSGNPYIEANNLNSDGLNLYFSKFNGPIRVLDIGAGEKAIKKALELRNIESEYVSMDVDVNNEFKYDYNDIDDINGLFDLIIMQGVLEALPLEKGLHYLEKSRDILKDSGYLVISISNTKNPNEFLNSDFAKVQHYPIVDLYGILRYLGFSEEVILRRIYTWPKELSFKRKILNIIKIILYKLMGFDFANDVLIMIKK